MKKTFIIMALVIAVATISTGAWARPWGGMGYGGMGPMISNMTPDQQSQILALQQGHQQKIAPIQEELFNKKMELRNLWYSQNPDQARINALQKEVFGLMEQLQQETSYLRADMLKVIAP